MRTFKELKNDLRRWKSGFADVRYDRLFSEKLQYQNGEFINHQKIQSQGSLCRVSGSSSFLSAQDFSSLSPVSGDFSKYLSSCFDLSSASKSQNVPLLDPVGIPISQDITDSITSLSLPHVSATLEYETRVVDHVNSLDHEIHREDHIQVLRIESEVSGSNEYYTLRKFLHAPTPEKIRSTELEMQTSIERLKGGKRVTPGVYEVVLHPSLAAVFVHEVIGHYVEMDLNRLTLSDFGRARRVTHPEMNVFDDPLDQNCALRMAFDDEGMEAKKVCILEDGFLVEGLYSLQSGFQLKTKSNGRGRAKDYRFSPRSRMTNIVLEPGSSSPDEMIHEVTSGVYLIGSLGGLFSSHSFQIDCQYGFLIENGRLTQPLLAPVISGNVFESLLGVKRVGSDTQWIDDGGCLAEEQFLLGSGRGAPHLQISRMNLS